MQLALSRKEILVILVTLLPLLIAPAFTSLSRFKLQGEHTQQAELRREPTFHSKEARVGNAHVTCSSFTAEGRLPLGPAVGNLQWTANVHCKHSLPPSLKNSGNKSKPHWQ